MKTEHPDHWELFIHDFFPRSLNRTQDRHWIHRHRRKRNEGEILEAFCLEQGGVPHFSGHVILAITRLWGKGQRKLDRANLYGACKMLEDVMRPVKPSGKGHQGRLGIIVDDTEELCDLRPRQRRNDYHIERWRDYECTLIEIDGKRIA